MIVFIITSAVLGIVAFASLKAGKHITEKYTASQYTKYLNPRYVAAIAAPAVCFVLMATALTLLQPPQGTFNVSNVDWETRQGGVLGATADAVLVRTTGATVESGFLYSTAVLSGNTYVSVLGSPWVACELPGVLATVCYAFLAGMATLSVFSVGKAVSAYECYMAVKATSPVAG
jgi:hypothetical protein